MKTRIIVDSTADLIPEIKERVHIVPLTLRFGEEEYIDGVTIDHKRFYEKLVESDVLPTTSQGTPHAFAKECLVKHVALKWGTICSFKRLTKQVVLILQSLYRSVTVVFQMHFY